MEKQIEEVAKVPPCDPAIPASQPASITFQRALFMVADLARNHGLVDEKDCDGDPELLRQREVALEACDMVDALEGVVRNGDPDAPSQITQGLYKNVAERLLFAYEEGERRGGSVQWSDLDDALRCAKSVSEAQSMKRAAWGWLTDLCLKAR
jgi:hypothetical protein